MFKILNSPRYAIVYYFFRWTAIIVPIAIVLGSVVALVLWLLNAATQYRFAHPWLFYLLPVAGVAIHFLYKLYGQSAERGNNLIIDEIHKPGGGVPKRMAPLILITTVITHLFGGSAGREGTAVQIGGSLANFIGSKFNLEPPDMRMVLTAGIAGRYHFRYRSPYYRAHTIYCTVTLPYSRYSWRCDRCRLGRATYGLPYQVYYSRTNLVRSPFTN
jgi:H+/Cl- antiporter ClcA